jgi:hypothetical protein
MIRNLWLRRSVVIALMGLGGLLMFLAPPVWVGAVPFALGVILEVIGVSIEHRSGK